MVYDYSLLLGLVLANIPAHLVFASVSASRRLHIQLRRKGIIILLRIRPDQLETRTCHIIYSLVCLYVRY